MENSVIGYGTIIQKGFPPIAFQVSLYSYKDNNVEGWAHEITNVVK